MTRVQRKCNAFFFQTQRTITMSNFTISMVINSQTYYLTYDTSTTPIVKIEQSSSPPKWEVIRMPRPQEYAGRPEGANFTLPEGLGKSKITNFSLQPNLTLYVDAARHQVFGKNGTDGQEWTFQQ